MNTHFKQKGCTYCVWWRHQMETFSALLAICVGNSSVTGEFPEQRTATWSFDVFFDLRLNKRLSKQSWGRWFETPSRPLWRHDVAIMGTLKLTCFPLQCLSWHSMELYQCWVRQTMYSYQRLPLQDVWWYRVHLSRWRRVFLYAGRGD